MQLTAKLTKDDYRAFRRFATYRLRRTWLVYVGLIAVGAWLTFPRDYAEHGFSFAVALVASIIAGILIAVMAYLLGLVLILILPNKPGTILGEHVFTITESEFQEMNDAGSASVKLDRLRRFETSKHTFLITPTHVGYIIPKRHLLANPEFERTLIDRTQEAG